MDAAVQGLRNFGIEIAMPDDATESRLDMRARTPKAVIEVEMAKGRVQVVTPEQADNAPAQPDAFGVPGRAADEPLRLGKLVDFLNFLGIVFALGALVGGLGVPTLSKGRLA
jgi:hypothetical protein